MVDIWHGPDAEGTERVFINTMQTPDKEGSAMLRQMKPVLLRHVRHYKQERLGPATLVIIGINL